MIISKSISRVLSWIVIYLVHILLYVSSHQIKKMTSSLSLLVPVLLQMGFTQPSMSPQKRWALTSPFHPYFVEAVIFCCTFLKVTLTRRYLASLLYGARTFLVRCLSTLLYATIQSTYKFYFNIFFYKCQIKKDNWGRGTFALCKFWLNIIKTYEFSKNARSS